MEPKFKIGQKVKVLSTERSSDGLGIPGDVKSEDTGDIVQIDNENEYHKEVLYEIKFEKEQWWILESELESCE